MAVLTDNDRADINARFQRLFSNVNNGAGTITKAELRAAVNAVDDWIDTNAAAFNTTIPQPARSALTAKQKASLFTYVVQRRYEVA